MFWVEVGQLRQDEAPKSALYVPARQGRHPLDPFDGL